MINALPSEVFLGAVARPGRLWLFFSSCGLAVLYICHLVFELEQI